MHHTRSPRRGRFAASCLLALILLGVPLLAARPATAAPALDCSGVTCTDVTFAGGGGLTLQGTVIAPATPHSDSPGIVLVGGSGPGPRAEYLYEARAFAAAGITTLIYDKRTTGYSFGHRDFSLLADDALSAVETLCRTPGVRADRVGLWGFSEGGWVAPLAASRSADVGFLVTLGASGRTPLRSQTWRLATALRHRVDAGPLADTVTGPAARLLEETGLFPAADFDPLPALRAVRIPVLALWGEHDVQTPSAESAAVLRDTLTAAPSVTIRFLTGSAHNGRSTTDGFDRLGPAPGPKAPRGAFAPGYFDTVTGWVHQVANGNPPASSADAPPRQAVISTDPGHGRWTSAWTQLTVLTVVLVGFVGYLLMSVSDRRMRHTRDPRRPARLLASAGLLSVFATVIYVVSILALNARTLGPIALSRPIVWLALQLLAFIPVGLLVVTGIASVRTWAALIGRSRIALGVLFATGCLWLAWAATWGLFAL
ncbi:alpha/beta hydrolase family protein [Nocardia pseudovaccinii]|uniref:alpha/beta hydrolase family protein n=1 Tax=Nocardia pseudovaccinii TaxID=189540 RepID=UPI003D902CAC